MHEDTTKPTTAEQRTAFNATPHCGFAHVEQLRRVCDRCEVLHARVVCGFPCQHAASVSTEFLFSRARRERLRAVFAVPRDWRRFVVCGSASRRTKNAIRRSGFKQSLTMLAWRKGHELLRIVINGVSALNFTQWRTRVNPLEVLFS